MMRSNVNLLKIIQLGITFSDGNGNFPNGVATWQFHFQFSLEYVFFKNIILIDHPLISFFFF